MKEHSEPSKEETKTDNELIAEWGYYVSESGIVFGKNGKPLKLAPGTGGYLQLNAHYTGIKRTFLVHRLVAEKYIANPENLPEVNHEDGNKLN